MLSSVGAHRENNRAQKQKDTKSAGVTPGQESGGSSPEEKLSDRTGSHLLVLPVTPLLRKIGGENPPLNFET